MQPEAPASCDRPAAGPLQSLFGGAQRRRPWASASASAFGVWDWGLGARGDRPRQGAQSAQVEGALSTRSNPAKSRPNPTPQKRRPRGREVPGDGRGHPRGRGQGVTRRPAGDELALPAPDAHLGARGRAGGAAAGRGRGGGAGAAAPPASVPALFPTDRAPPGEARPFLRSLACPVDSAPRSRRFESDVHPRRTP